MALKVFAVGVLHGVCDGVSAEEEDADYDGEEDDNECLGWELHLDSSGRQQRR